MKQGVSKASAIYYVEIVDIETGEVVKWMGPMTRHKAGKVADGVEINLDNDKYETRIVLG